MSVSLQGPLLGQSLLEICEGSIGRHAAADRRAATTASRFQLPLVLVVVAVHAQQFPVAAIGWVVVMIMVAVVDGQFPHVEAGELAAAAPADPRVDLQRAFPVALLALLGSATGFGDDAI